MDLHVPKWRAYVFRPERHGVGTRVDDPQAQQPTRLGFIYMLAGDTGASNTDPWATEKTADNHWIQTGSHVMILRATAKTMAAGYQKAADPDPSKPNVMWPDSPYGHLMIPVK